MHITEINSINNNHFIKHPPHKQKFQSAHKIFLQQSYKAQIKLKTPSIEMSQTSSIVDTTSLKKKKNHFFTIVYPLHPSPALPSKITQETKLREALQSRVNNFSEGNVFTTITDHS